MIIKGHIDIAVFMSVLKNWLGFLKSLFICSLLGYMAMRMHGKRWIWIASTVIASQAIQIWNISTMYPCFLLGIMISRKRNWFENYWKPVTAISALIFLMILIPIIINPIFWQIRSSSILKAATFQDAIIICLCRTLTMLTGMLASISMIVGSYMLFKTVTKLPQCIQKMVSAGRYTLGVYVIQTVVVETLMAHYFPLPYMGVVTFWLVSLMIFPIVAAGLTYSFTWMTAYVCHKLPLTAMILFGEKVRHK